MPGNDAAVNPAAFHPVFKIEGQAMGRKPLYLWQMKAPAGYVAVGLAATAINEPPSTEDYVVIKKEFVRSAVGSAQVSRLWTTRGCNLPESR